VAFGCGASAKVSVPRFSPQDASNRALEEFDANKDGVLDLVELAHCPPLKSCLKAADKDQDGLLSASEIADRLAFYVDTNKSGPTSIGLTVMLDGVARVGATVTLVPEKFLGPEFKTSSGVCDEVGQVYLYVEGGEVAGVFCGLYRVQISQLDAGGNETIAAKYNAQTTLGLEVAPDLRGSIELFLTSK